MAKQNNMWVFVIIALIVGIIIGYGLAGGFSTSGNAIAKPARSITLAGCSGAGNQAGYCSQIGNKDDCIGSGVCTWTD